MKTLIPAFVLAAGVGAAAAYFAPARESLVGRPAVKTDESGQPVTAKALSALTDAERAEAEKAIKRVDELDGKLDRHQEAMAAEWNELLSGVTRDQARRTVEGQRISGVVAAVGGKPVEAQVEDLMDDTARKRVKGMVKGWMDAEANALKTYLALVGTQAAAVDQLVADILNEEGAKVDQGEPSDNMLGWRGDIMNSARQKLEERIDPLLTGEQKLKAGEWFKSKDWGRGWREAQKSAEGK